MKTLRWIVCFPGAVTLSFLAWALGTQFFTGAYYGPVLHLTIVGLAPFVAKTAIPAFVLVIAGAVLSPSKERRMVFVFFALALLFSAGGIELLSFASQSDVGFWLSANLGTVLGSLAGLGIALRIQSWRKKREPNQPPQHNAMTGPFSDCERHSSRG